MTFLQSIVFEPYVIWTFNNIDYFNLHEHYTNDYNTYTMF